MIIKNKIEFLNISGILFWRRVLFFSLFILSVKFCDAQEITKLTTFAKHPYPTNSPVSPKYSDEIYEHNGRYYWMIGDVDKRFNDLIAELEIEEFDYAVNPNDISEQRRGRILLEYTPGEGFTDYILFNHGFGLNQMLSFDGDNLLVLSNSKYPPIV